MSQEQAELFMRYVQNDVELQQRINALRGRDAIAQMAGIAAERGFTFTESDYREAVIAEAAGELSAESIDDLSRQLGMQSDEPES